MRSVDAHSVRSKRLGHRLEERRPPGRTVSAPTRSQAEGRRSSEEGASAVSRFGTDIGLYESADRALRIGHSDVQSLHLAVVQSGRASAPLHVLTDVGRTADVMSRYPG